VRSLLLFGIALAMTSHAWAQWLKLPTPGIPRLADGKPNLDARRRAPLLAKPDFSASGRTMAASRLYNNIAVDLKPGTWRRGLMPSTRNGTGIREEQHGDAVPADGARST
jgi:hypothetical protein